MNVSWKETIELSNAVNIAYQFKSVVITEYAKNANKVFKVNLQVLLDFLNLTNHT